MKLGVYRSFLPLFFMSFFSQTLFLSAQEPIALPEGVPPESEWAYGQHLGQVEEMMDVSDLAERVRQLESFMNKLHPDSKILQYYESFFNRTVEDYQRAGQTQEATALTNKMLQLFPDSVSLLTQELRAAIQAQDYARAIELGEKLQAIKPDQQTTVLLAQSYIATNNAAKASEYSQKALEALGPKEGLYFAYWLATYHTGQRQMDKVVEYYDMVLKAYPQGTPSGWDAGQWNTIKATAYGALARVAYDKEDFPGAIQNYGESLRYQPQNDLAYLSMGLSYWKLQQLEPAMDVFAKAVVLGKDHSAKAREYLEQIYKPLNSDSLDGLDALLAKARTELN
jgi:tetratricopeptide (TPR) repeat protein